MFNLLKRNHILTAPMDGKVVDLSTIQDKVFSKKLVGEGVAIDPTNDVVVAPADGKLSLLFKTNHAFGMVLDNGIEILIHIGIDTIGLESEGFNPLVKEGDMLKSGEPVIKIDRELIINKGYSLITPIIITNVDVVKEIEYNTNENVKSGEDTLLTYKL
ncbi:PTS glucose transporter subunit IIA [Clostridium sp. MSJ-11]|uniref:PTS glucose transporter subunit IIA n=1 Tax=Clostridium mobile TaxID=2841512 RepID=A0ABS6EM85_9CLOT|nr:PTS glucose transporter subunit IIA [Clostridium mobile]MBU5486237.1 PTS glucose transporter subunit IIA [Clostridium mobile]